ncbi:MAG: aldose 1-epimerase [Planctomycetes bacterium]|nr:aldose 1-epimerase [Planctomycetota bacterium]
MAFEVRITQGKAGDRSGDVYELTDGRVRAEVWPQWGFNCLKWQLRQDDGRWADVLYHMPDWETNPVPTRSGHPILFPFPGRLRDGRLTHDGKAYQLPLNDSTKQHAIHGFTPRNKWRVTDSNGDEEFAFVTGEFSLKKDLPEALPLWPSDFVFSVTYRLYPDKLRVDARVENPGPGRLPFGLGYHGYFRLPGLNEPDIGTSVLQANVAEIWEAENNLPTGWRKEPPAELDFQKPRPIGATALDNVFTKVTGAETRNSGFLEIARLTHPGAGGRLRVLADASFRELVLFTPAHRQAVAIEPYTCSADAGNFAARGIDSGWRVLEPGGEWEGAVEYRWEPAEL